MGIYYIDGVSGNDSPAGANNVARLATIKDTPAAALKTLARLAAIANGAVGEGATTPLQGETIYVNGEIVGTYALPDLACALFNCASLGTPSLLTYWPSTAATPPAGKFLDAGLRGDVDINGNTPAYTGTTVTFAAGTTATQTAHPYLEGSQVSFTNSGGALPSPLVANTTYYVRQPATNTYALSATPTGALITFAGAGTGTHTAGLYWTATLPTSMTSANVGRCLIYADESTAIDGTPSCDLDLVASAALVASTPNSYFIDGARVLYINFTNNQGIIQNGNSTMRLDSSVGQGVSLSIVAAANSSNGTAGNALVCFQNATGMTIRGLTTRNQALTSYGLYPISFEQAVNCTYENIFVCGGGHHFLGCTGTGAMNGATVKNCYGARGLGQTAGAFGGSVSFVGSTVSNVLMQDCTWENGSVLNPLGAPNTRQNSLSSNLWVAAANNANGLSNVNYKRCMFIPKQQMLPGINGGGQILNTTPLAAGTELSSQSYPVQFDQCLVGPTIVAQHFTGGAGDTYGNSSHRRGLWLMTGADGSGYLAGRATPFIAADSAWGGGLPDPMPRNILFENQLIIIKAGQRQPFIGALTFTFTSGTSAWALRFKNCVILDLSKHARGCNVSMFDYTSAAGNCVYQVEDSIIITQPQDSSGVVTQLCSNDNGLANAATRRKFSRNLYVGFSAYSADASYNEQNEWLTNVDTGATFASSLNLRDSSTVSLFQSKLGGSSWLNGASLANILGASQSGLSNIVPLVAGVIGVANRPWNLR